MRTTSARASVAATLGLAAVLGGCATLGGPPPTVLMDSPYGPPEFLGGTPPPPPPPLPHGSLSGTYAGVAVPLNTGGGRCFQNESVGNFQVNGLAVRWGNTQGVATPDGGLEMVYGSVRVFGWFYQDAFRGQLSLPGLRNEPGCTYTLLLRRVSG